MGNSPAMQLARRQVELAADSRSSVLLVGLQGSGRQHLAKAIHYANPLDFTATSPAGGLIPLDCSVLSEDTHPIDHRRAGQTHPSNEEAKQATLLLNHVG